MAKLQRLVVVLSALSLAGLGAISATYFAFKMEAKGVSDLIGALGLLNTHPGGAIDALLSNTFFLLNGGRHGLGTSVEHALALVMVAALFVLSSTFFFHAAKPNIRSSTFLVAGIFNGTFYLIVLAGIANIYSECSPAASSWCGVFGDIAIVFVAPWFLLFSLALLAFTWARRLRSDDDAQEAPSQTD